MVSAVDHLHVLHDPFSSRTDHPKIPDGKAQESLGVQSQIVREIVNRPEADDSTRTIHLMLYPGKHSCVIMDQTLAGEGAPLTPSFPNMGYLDFSGIIMDPEMFNWDNHFTVQEYGDEAQWRVVSAGLRLKLLNAAETDEGWWEAIRVNKRQSPIHWAFVPLNQSGNTSIGTLCPQELLKELETSDDLATDNTYSTGLLRDLYRVQFELHGHSEQHDFHHCKDEMRVDGAAGGSFAAAGTKMTSANFSLNGHDDVYELINTYTDTSYDMIYIRLHCRANNGTGTEAGSSFHLHAIMNHENVYADETDYARFHTVSDSIGSGAMSVHTAARRSQIAAATFIG